jgi:hypothetical protein
MKAHQFSYPRVTEVRRVSLKVAAPPLRQVRAGSQPVSAPSAVERP